MREKSAQEILRNDKARVGISRLFKFIIFHIFYKMYAAFETHTKFFFKEEQFLHETIRVHILCFTQILLIMTSIFTRFIHSFFD